MNEKPAPPRIGQCVGCLAQQTQIFFKYKLNLCEYCVQVVESKHFTKKGWCPCCEDMVLLIGDHPCAVEASVEWLELLAKLK